MIYNGGSVIRKPFKFIVKIADMYCFFVCSYLDQL